MPDSARRHRSNLILVALVVLTGAWLYARTNSYQGQAARAHRQAVAAHREECVRARAFSRFLTSDARLRQVDVLSGRGSVVLWDELAAVTAGTRQAPIYLRFAAARERGARASETAAAFWLKLARAFRYGC